jgi:hypothetical protein
MFPYSLHFIFLSLLSLKEFFSFLLPISFPCPLWSYYSRSLCLSWFLLPFLPFSLVSYRRVNNSRPMSFTVSESEWVYATNSSRLQRETREIEIETHKRHVGEHTVYSQQRSYYLNVWVVTGAEQCHCAYTQMLGSPACVWPLRNREPPAKICRPTYACHSASTPFHHYSFLSYIPFSEILGPVFRRGMRTEKAWGSNVLHDGLVT